MGPLGPISLGIRPLEEQLRNQGGTLNCKGEGRHECDATWQWKKKVPGGD